MNGGVAAPRGLDEKWGGLFDLAGDSVNSCRKLRESIIDADVDRLFYLSGD